MRSFPKEQIRKLLSKHLSGNMEVVVNDCIVTVDGLVPIRRQDIYNQNNELQCLVKTSVNWHIT